MAEGGEEDMFRLLPSDIRAIVEVQSYATERRDDLSALKKSVYDKGWFPWSYWLKLFLDSKVPKSNKSLTYFFNRHKSDPEAIVEEIEKCLNFFNLMLTAVDKVDDENKGEAERRTPYLVIINLTSELTNLFDVAKSQLNSTSSRKVSNMYKEFLRKQSEVENRMRKLEVAFLKQQLSRGGDANEPNGGEIRRVVDQQEGRINDVADQLQRLQGDNTNLQNTLEELGKRFDVLLGRYSPP